MGLFTSEPKQMNLMLTEDDFKCLVRGGVLTINSHLNLALQDIGFELMHDAVELAENGIDIYKPRNRETNDGKGY